MLLITQKLRRVKTIVQQLKIFRCGHGSGSGSRATGQLELCPLVFAWCVCVCCLVNLIWLLFAHFFLPFCFLFLTVFNCQSWFVWKQLLKVEKWKESLDDHLSTFFPVQSMIDFIIREDLLVLLPLCTSVVTLGCVCTFQCFWILQLFLLNCFIFAAAAAFHSFS